MSRTFAANSGSEESAKPSVRCGLRPKARQTRCTVAGESPQAAAIERGLQWGGAPGIAVASAVLPGLVGIAGNSATAQAYSRTGLPVEDLQVPSAAMGR